MTEHRETGGLKQQKFIDLDSGRRKLRSGYQQGHCPRALGELASFWCLPAAGKPRRSSACSSVVLISASVPTWPSGLCVSVYLRISFPRKDTRP